MSDEQEEPWADLIRARINAEGRADVRIAAYQMEEPYDFGRFIADVVRHGAIAFATTWSMDESHALEKICDGLSDQLREQNTKVWAEQEGSLDS
ncbi:MAG: DUF5076 domain-containing protein [Alphaproteobacteria bacterium]|nr:DUF5076 domain-containing protein [Alphaproteobacteria bacterium]